MLHQMQWEKRNSFFKIRVLFVFGTVLLAGS
jgi:hypothetical protein